MRYEKDMSIIYDVFSKSVMISFREQEHTLAGPFPNQRAAVHAAEQFCVERGWLDPRPRSGSPIGS
ncbi:hypothetical protein C8J34_12229 [Rhizobium sp. PP-F2F-G36]|nr:hypothetical protein C8J34_12229 [Rhizobium sp. PP-F2F-G36]